MTTRQTDGLYHGYKPRLPEFGHKLLPLPPYSPEYNPIEKTWAHIKKHRKKESGTEIGNSLEFDFVVPPPHS